MIKIIYVFTVESAHISAFLDYVILYKLTEGRSIFSNEMDNNMGGGGGGAFILCIQL